MSPRLSDLFLSSQSDERLVALARAGHERAFAAIVERYRPELHALARRLCSDGRGEDVVQQAFLSAFAALRAGSEVKHLRGWLYQIVRNAAARPAGPHCVPLEATEAVADSLEDVVQQRALAMTALSELARLPARQRQAMIGTALDGRGRAELARSMGLSEGAVRQLVHRARATLRGAVTALTPWPLARWLAAIGPGAPGGVDLAAGAGAASSGGLAFKLGALLASGTFLTGAAVVDLHRAPAHRPGARAALAGHSRSPAAHTASVHLAAASPLEATALSASLRLGDRRAGSGRRVTATHSPSLRRGGRGATVAGSGGRSDGQRVAGRDGGGSRGGGAASSGRTGRGDGSQQSAGAGGGSRHDGATGGGDSGHGGAGQSGGDRTAGGGSGHGDGGQVGSSGASGGDSGQGSATTGSGGGDAQMASAYQADANFNRTSSYTPNGGTAGSGDSSGSASTGSGSSASGSGASGSGSTSGSTSGSGDVGGTSSDGGSGGTGTTGG